MDTIWHIINLLMRLAAIIFMAFFPIAVLIDLYRRNYRPTRVRVGYPDNWASVREKVKKRDEYKCVLCSKTSFLQIHHIIPLSKGGTNNLSNMETVCRNCHEEIHPHMKEKRLRKDENDDW